MSIEKLNEICSKHRIPACHSDFQIANFIIGKETSLVGKQWQCLRELQGRKESVELLEFELAEVDDNIALAKIDLQKLNKKINESDDLKKEKLQIFIRKQERKINKLNKGKSDLLLKKQDLENEISMLVQIFEALTEKYKFLEFNNPKAQMEYWNAKLETELNMNSVLNLPTGSELVKTIMALPEAAPVRKRMLEALTFINKKLLEGSN